MFLTFETFNRSLQQQQHKKNKNNKIIRRSVTVKCINFIYIFFKY